MKKLLMSTLSACLMLMIASCSQNADDEAPPDPPIDNAAVNESYYQCLIDSGVPVTVSDDGAVSYNAQTEELARVYAEAEATCQTKVEDQYPQLASDQSELDDLYDRMTAVQECVAASGIAVGEWPTRNVFIDNGGDFSVPITLEPLTFAEVENLCPDQVAALP